MSPAAAPPEGPERPRRDSGATRARILACAMSEFARHGYDGARVDAIVARAGISKNLLYHHFEGKEGLFVAVMEAAYDEMRARHRDLEIKTLDPATGMAALVSHTFQHFIEQPAIVPLLNSENLHKARHISRSARIREMYNPLLETIRDLLERGQAEGVFRRDADPVHLYISISALGYFYLSNRHTLSFIFATDLSTEARLAERHQHIIDVILGYLRYEGPDVRLRPESLLSLQEP
jgi:TetR/AcrR family transcriptional regulator